MLEFPEGFWWGGATSGPQSEGRFQKPHRHLFDYWYEQRPELFMIMLGLIRPLIFFISMIKT